MRWILLLAVSMGVSQAAEFTAETKPFRVERNFTATLWPEGLACVVLEPAAWSEFTIEEIAPHGSRVEKGDLLIRFKRGGIDRKLDDLRRAVKARELVLANHEWSFAKLIDETSLKQEAARRAARIANEELDHFTRSGRKADEDEARDALEGSRRRLEAAREELKQLRMMYEADDLTEQTEEIILKRQQYAVESAELALRLAELGTQRKLEAMLPRRLEELTSSARAAAIEWEKVEKNSPRELERARLDLEAAKELASREQADLADLEKDAQLMELRAVSDGVFYHGGFHEGRWLSGDAAKSLVKGGTVLLMKPFATLVPAGAKMRLTAHIDEATARSLIKGLEGSVVPAGREDLFLPTRVAAVGEVPGADGAYRVDLDADFGEALPRVAGTKFDCRFLVYRNDAAIAIPIKALHAAERGGWEVELKMADGKSEFREVVRGRISGDRIEIQKGLENGQVVILPD